MDGPKNHETSARCRASRSEKHSSKAPIGLPSRRNYSLCQDIIVYCACSVFICPILHCSRRCQCELHFYLITSRKSVFISSWYIVDNDLSLSIRCGISPQTFHTDVSLQGGINIGMHTKQEGINPSWPNDAYMRQWTRPPVVQIMACRFWGVKPLSEPMLIYSRLQ